MSATLSRYWYLLIVFMYLTTDISQEGKASTLLTFVAVGSSKGVALNVKSLRATSLFNAVYYSVLTGIDENSMVSELRTKPKKHSSSSNMIRSLVHKELGTTALVTRKVFPGYDIVANRVQISAHISFLLNFITLNGAFFTTSVFLINSIALFTQSSALCKHSIPNSKQHM